MENEITFVKRDWIDGYLLEVADFWDNYSADERELMTNGIGVDWMPLRFRDGLDDFSGFLPPSKEHDFSWEVLGRAFRNHRFGRATYRRLIKQADKRFYRNCRETMRQDGDTLFRRPLKYFKRRRIAKLFYRAVRIGAIAKTAERRK